MADDRLTWVWTLRRNARPLTGRARRAAVEWLREQGVAEREVTWGAGNGVTRTRREWWRGEEHVGDTADEALHVMVTRAAVAELEAAGWAVTHGSRTPGGWTLVWELRRPEGRGYCTLTAAVRRWSRERASVAA